MASNLDITLKRHNGTDIDNLYPTTTWSQVESKPSTFTPTSHTHGNITNGGAIGSTANLMVKTTTSGVLTTLAAGTTSQFLRGDGVWATPADSTTLSSLGITATASELNTLDGITATVTELNYTDGVTSNIQTQLNGKAASSHTHDDRYYTETEINTLLSSKLNTSHDMTLTLSGDASGSATFTDMGNATLTVAIADDSHNHIISNVDGLQTALDGKLSTSGKAADSNLLDGLDLNSTTRNNEVNKVMRTDSNGYANFGWINTTSGNTTNAVTDVYVNTNDGYIRKKTLALFKTELGSMPASDVYAWAKASTKPTYSAAEVGAMSTSHPANLITSTHLYMANGDGFVWDDTLNKMYVRKDGADSELLDVDNIATYANGIGLALVTDLDDYLELSSFNTFASDNATNLNSKLNLSGGTMTVNLYPQQNTSYTTGQARRIILSTASPSGGGNGDVWIKYTA